MFLRVLEEVANVGEKCPLILLANLGKLAQELAAGLYGRGESTLDNWGER